MTMRWFGRKYDAPVYDDCPRIDTPVGDLCIGCGEAIEAGDDGFQYANGPNAHRPCYLRSIIGSVAHLEKRCGCYVSGSSENDDPGLSRREAAKAATELFESRGPNGGQLG